MLALLAVGGYVLLRDNGTQIIAPEGAPAGNDASTREDSAARLLGRLQSGLAEGDRPDVVALAAPDSKGAARRMGDIFDNARQLGLEDLSFRYVDENEGHVGAGEWVADVQVSWRIAGFDKVASQMEVPIAFARTSQGAAFVSVDDAADNSAPLWLLDKVAVERGRRSLVMVADESRVRHYASLARRAAADVKRVLPRWRGRLVVEVPGSEEDLERIVGAENDAYQSIAAVTSTVDGSLDPSSPAHVLVNPTVFRRLSGDGAQIVISHEATHVATSAATSSIPMWLLEGFADYVALAHVDLPVSTTASQILAEVRKSGVPSHLPTAREFDPANKALGTSYEAAWLACRLIGMRYGEQRLIELYDRVERGLSVNAGFRRVLDTDRRTFVSQWQDYLRDLASEA